MRQPALAASCLAAALTLSACGGGADLIQPNRPPVANAGPAQTVTAGTLVTINGSGSDPDQDILSYLWAFAKPAGSAAALTNAHVATTIFLADIPGTYTATLIVNDQQVDSKPSTVTITVTPKPAE